MVILVTGLILSFEPMLMDRSLTGRSISLDRVESALAKHDPAGKATTLNVRAYDNAILLAEGPRKPAIRIDLATGERLPADRSLWSDVFTTSRRLHESLLLDLKWLVDTATIAMLVSLPLGLLIGRPVFRNTLSGWHRVTAWTSLPLLLLSPLTGLAIAYGVMFTGPAPTVQGPPLALREETRVVAKSHDLADVYWIRPMGSVTRARIYDGGETRVFGVGASGLVAGPTAWPRALHEGVWAGAWSALVNIVTSIALIGLMVSGLWIWARRRLRMRGVRQRRTA